MDKKKEELLELDKQAAEKIKSFAKEDNKAGYGLRLFVFPGGCSGMQYGMDFEEKATEKDVTVEQHGLKIFIDKELIGMIKGSKINLTEHGFNIENPNSKGCSSCTGSC